MGIISCIGNSKAEVLESLKAGKSGITENTDYAERGFRSQVSGRPVVDLDALIDRKLRRFMGDGAAYNHLAMEQAVLDSGLSEDRDHHGIRGAFHQ
jgi:3-oxoacyl-[acyl-carrier-protein] synthase-1